MPVADLEYFEQLLRRLRRECESVSAEVGTSGDKLESSRVAESVGALRVEVAAALKQVRAPEASWASYEKERERLLVALKESEAEVRRLEEVVAADVALQEVEGLLNANSLIAAARTLQQVSLLQRRRRELCGTLEARALEMAMAAIEISEGRVAFRKRCSEMEDDDAHIAGIVTCLEIIGAQDRFFDDLAADLEPVLLKATHIVNASSRDVSAVDLAQGPPLSADAVSQWLRFLSQEVGLNDASILAIHSRMSRWPAEPLREAIKAGHIDPPSQADAEQAMLGPLASSIRLKELAEAAYQDAAAEVITTARDIVLGDWHNDSEVESRDVLSTIDGDELETATKMLRVSLLAQRFVGHAGALLDKAIDAPPHAATHLFRNARRLFELYRALFPLAHADTVRAQPRMADLFQNDILFLLRAANRFSIHHCPKLNAKFPTSPPLLFTFVDQLAPLRDLANSLVALA